MNADRQNIDRDIAYRAHYSRGMAASILTLAILLAILAVIVVQNCSQNASEGNTMYPYGYSNVNCSSVYQHIFPIAFILFFIGVAVLRRAQATIVALGLNGGQPAAVIGGGFIYAPPISPAMQQQQLQQYTHPQLHLQAQYAQQPLQQAAETSEQLLPAYSVGEYKYPGEQLPSAGPSSAISESEPPPVEIAPAQSSLTNPLPPQPFLQSVQQISLESLAVELEIPKLLNVHEGLTGVMHLSYNEMRDRYGITADEYFKIKKFRKLNRIVSGENGEDSSDE
ncbi:hypothetical protein HK100_005173 [Physocladia obscura]|uniref:Uncharacterized protein n=1 Tax=Physocladia obscura TaxID=109957 RepID=A0AAD5SXL9_9FUNG|nr:hypothetical protein HK100_005173 [Physocladia obscura]